MAQPVVARRPFSSLRTCFHRWHSRIQEQQHHRSIVTIHRGTTQKLAFPQEIPPQYWSQIPTRFRPDKVKKEIKIHAAPISEREVCKDPIAVVHAQQQALLDPSGARTRLFDPKNRDGAKPGDILLVTFKTGEPFSGIVMSIKQRGPHTSVLLRNHLTRIGTEMQIKVFSPLVQSMEIAQKAIKRKRRARLYYLRKPKHDVGSVQKIVDQYLRQRALLSGARSSNSGQRGMRSRR